MGSKKKPSRDELKRLADAMPQNDIAKLIGVSPASVSMWMKDYGIRKIISLIPPKEDLIALYEGGLTHQEVADKYSVHPHTVLNWQKKYGLTKSRTRDITNQRFGKLVAIERLEERGPRGNVQWVAKCDCGNTTVVNYSSLIGGNVKSCGCLKRSRRHLEGQRFGSLVVMRPFQDVEDHNDAWLCQCDCGNEAIVWGGDLLKGRVTSCGCKQTAIKDLMGQRFGRWIAIYPLKEKNANGSAVWHCKCDCGNEGDVSMRSLVTQGSRSCGCLKHDLSVARVGPASPTWKESLTDKDRTDTRNFPEYREWREEVYKRDNYTCQYCGDSVGGNLNAHHIEDYSNNPELRTTLSNGITLCKRCHRNFHHKYGNKINTLKQFEEWMSKEDECE